MTGETAGASAAQIIPILIVYLLFVGPFWMLFRKIGRSGAWALVGFVPLVGIFVLPWMLLFMRWRNPMEEGALRDVFE